MGVEYCSILGKGNIIYGYCDCKEWLKLFLWFKYLGKFMLKENFVLCNIDIRYVRSWDVENWFKKVRN